MRNGGSATMSLSQSQSSWGWRLCATSTGGSSVAENEAAHDTSGAPARVRRLHAASGAADGLLLARILPVTRLPRPLGSVADLGSELLPANLRPRRGTRRPGRQGHRLLVRQDF